MLRLPETLLVRILSTRSAFCTLFTQRFCMRILPKTVTNVWLNSLKSLMTANWSNITSSFSRLYWLTQWSRCIRRRESIRSWCSSISPPFSKSRSFTVMETKSIPFWRKSLAFLLPISKTMVAIGTPLWCGLASWPFKRRLLEEKGAKWWQLTKSWPNFQMQWVILKLPPNTLAKFAS